MSDPSLRDSPDAPVARWEIVALAVAMGVGALLRFWGLSVVPPGLWYDEAINGLDALAIMREPGWPLFFDTRGHPREPLYIYLNVPAILLGGSTAQAIRAVSAVIGVVTIPAVWWMARALAGPRVALAALVAITCMRWHVHFSRTAFRTIMTPLFAALVLTFLVRWMRGRPGWNLVVAAGLAALSLYTYLSMRLFVAAMIVVVGLHLWRYRAVALRPAFRQVGLAAAVGFVVFLPLGLNYLMNPDHFTGRQDQVSLLDQGSEGLARIAMQTRDVALMGLVRGDHEAKHNIPGNPRFSQAYFWGPDGRESAAAWQDARAVGDDRDVHGTGLPVFDALIGVLFYAGLALIVWQAITRRRVEEIAVVLWLLFGSLASILSFGAPNMLRLQLLTPVAAFALGVAAVRLYDRVALSAAGRPVAAGLVILIGVWFGVGETKRYFVDWPHHPETWFRFNSNFAELGLALGELAQETPEALLFVPAYIADAPTFQFEIDGVPLRMQTDFDEAPSRIESAGLDDGGTRLYVVPRPPFPPLQVELGANARPVRSLEQPDGAVWCVIYREP